MVQIFRLSGSFRQKKEVSNFSKEICALTEEHAIEKLYTQCELPHSPNVEAVKKLFLECLEMHFGSLSDVVELEKAVDMLVNDIQNVLRRY